MKRLVGYFKKEQLAKSGSIIFISDLVAGLFNYIYQIYMDRVLGPEEYDVLRINKLNEMRNLTIETPWKKCI